MDAVRQLLDEETFHEATVEEIAERAGVARATVYQHFGSRMGLTDAICDVVGESPEYQAIGASLDLEDPVEALRGVIANAVRLWESEEGMHRHLYGLAEIDPAAREFVERQTRDRRSVLARLIDALRHGRRLRRGTRDADALAQLLLLTSFHTFEELRRNGGLAPAAIERTLTRLAEGLLV